MFKIEYALGSDPPNRLAFNFVTKLSLNPIVANHSKPISKPNQI